MSLDIASIKRSSSESDGEKGASNRTSVEIERAANTLVPGDAERLADGEAALSTAYTTWAIMAPNMYNTVTGTRKTEADLDDAATEPLTTDLPVDELVQQRKQFA